MLPKSPPAKLVASIIGDYSNAQRGSITIEQSGDDAKVTYRGNNRYSFSGYRDHIGQHDVELSYGEGRGLPLQLQFGDGEAVQAITLFGVDYHRKD